MDANAGYVRAALYIKNTSVNMPVKLTNILCSLMFENGTGDLIPIQSFRLRNDDYSLFEVSVYGGSEFGPYVVQLSGLNTSEIENAIAAGYNPKIFIVDYEMSHVPDSNYKSALLNFSGNNLKIIEENAKGRTGLIRVYGPNMRQMYRVAAFDVPDSSDPCARTATSLSPGITLRKALERLQCNGLKIEFQDYVIDLSEIAPALGEYKLHLKGIKTLGPVPTNIPCVNETHTGSDGVTRTACVQKPLSTWTEEEKTNAGVWAIYSNGRYYNLTEYFKDLDDSIRTFDPTNSQKTPMVKGVDSVIWAGDYYDIVYISFKDLLKKEEEQTFGTNPLETQREYKLNTSWDLNSLGSYPYDPEVKSLFLGKLGFGERFELNIKLDNNQYLTPNFGTPIDGGLFQYFSNFSYNITTSVPKLSIDQVADLEISMGFGGQRSDWFHIVKDLDNSNSFKLKNCGRTLDYVNQLFTLCIELPTEHEYVDPEVSLINLYLRPSLSNAYRRTIWPLPYQDVRKMRGELGNPAEIGDTTIKVSNGTGLAEVGENIYILGDPNAYPISSIGTPASDGSYIVTLGTTIKKTGKKTTEVFVKGTLTAADVRLTVENGFQTDWNTQVQSSFIPDAWNTKQFLPFETTSSVSCSSTPFHPLSCLGVTPNLDAINWSGAYNKGVALWNSWADASYFPSFLSSGLFGLSTNSGKVYRLDASKSDAILSENVGSGSLYSPKVVVYNNIALVVRGITTANSLTGRYFNITTGQALTGEFALLSNYGGYNDYSIDIKGSKVLLAWRRTITGETDTHEIYFDAFDISSLPTASRTGVLVESLTESNQYSCISCVSVAGTETRAIVSWKDGTNTSTHYVKGRVYQLDPITPLANSFTAISQSATSAYNSHVFSEAEGSIGFIGGIMNTNAQDFRVGFKLVNLTTGTLTGSGIIFSDSSSSAGNISHLSLTDYGSKHLGTWIESDGTLYGAILDSSGNSFGSKLTFDTSVTNVQTEASGNIAYVSYSKANRIYIRTVDLSSGQFQSNSPLVVDSTNSATSKKMGSLIISGNTIVLLWEHLEGGKSTIRGRSVSLSPLAVKGPGDFFVSTTNEGNQTAPEISGSGNNGFAVWLSQDILQPRVRGAYMNIANPGALQYGMNNFFIAPMIERDFTIWTKVTE
ncbi:LIC12048 family lipoprotein [Leptospira sp. id769339]|uniref:LIC12048 family lipoprotein n=1 Tax=Leptospira sp. id769339 TaxID=2864221 RepID=UPI00214B7EE5